MGLSDKVYRLMGLYRMRSGFAPSSSRRLRLFVSYSWKRKSEYYRPIPEIDQWLRRRIRMC